MNGDSTVNSNSNNDGSNKRRAQIGQWTTPPQPFFPNTTTSANINTGVNGGMSSNKESSTGGISTEVNAMEIPIPSGVDPKDYAALQEAYRRGAAAAAALAHPHHAAAQQALFAAGFAAARQQHQHHPINPSLNAPVPQSVQSMMNVNMQQSVPDTQKQQQPNQQPQAPQPQQQQQQQQHDQQTSNVPKHLHTSLMAATASSLQSAPTTSNPLQQKQPQQQTPLIRTSNNIAHHPGSRPTQLPNPSAPIMGISGPAPTAVTSSSVPTVPAKIPAPMNMNFNIGNDMPAPVGPTVGTPAGVGMGGVGMNAVGSRSMSLPDMARYAARATAEDHKRKKRLARNRASARLRRLKKKNLVDTYEGEVGVLEAALAKLQAHSWGSDHDHEALLEALSMDRGQQQLPPEKRQFLIHDILKQQREQVQNIRDVHFEVMLLGWLANQQSESNSSNAPETNVEDPAKKAEKAEEEMLASELSDLLCLTSEQKSELKKATATAHDELKAIETVDMCLEAMLNNSWIMNHPVEEITQQFMSILNAGQMSKFLLWTDHNSDAIDQLDYVNAPPAAAPPAQSPSFVFGTDNEGAMIHGEGGEGDEMLLH